MTTKPFRESTIGKIKKDFFRNANLHGDGPKKVRKELANLAGIHGLSTQKMEEELKKRGYVPKKRENIMGQVLKKKSESFTKKPEGLTEQQKERNIRRSRMELRTAGAVDSETSARVAGHGSFAGGKVETRSRVALDRDEIGKAPGRFGLSGPSSPSQGMVNPAMPSIGGLGPKRFL